MQAFTFPEPQRLVEDRLDVTGRTARDMAKHDERYVV